jgi:translation initiation factor 1
MSNNKLVWSDDSGDQRKAKEAKQDSSVNIQNLMLLVRRLTSGKGRTVIEITGLPKNKAWCKDLATQLKKSLGVGGTFKDQYIEIHGEKINLVTEFLDTKSIKWKKIGG